jgi:AcrR family transcriptional regulator
MVHIAGQLQTFIHQQSASASLAQIGNTPEAASLIFSGPQFFIALISGLILAFGFQMLLTNLSVAIGMSVLSASSGSSRDSDSGMGVRTIGIGVGLWTLITVSIALFSACFLAVKMGLFASDLLGAITGLVIWALYFTSLVLISSTTVGSLVGSVVSTATSSFQAIMGTATAALGAQAVSSKFVATASATAAAVRQELLGSMDSEDIQDKLQGYIKALRSPQIDLQGVTQEFEQLLADTDLSAVDSIDGLQHIDRQTFVDLVSSRTDLAKQEINRIADQLYKRWQQTVGQQSNGQWVQELVGYFQSATPDQLVSDQVAQRLDQLLDEMRQRRQSSSPSLLDRVLPMLSSLVMGRTDLSDMDANRITGQIKMVKNQLVEQVDQLATQFSDETERAPSIVRADVENYLLNTYVWQMSPERLRQDFWSVLYDQNADPGLVRRELEQLDRTFFAELLESRGLLSQTEIRKVSQCLDGIRQNVLKTAWAEEATLAQQELLQRVETYLTYTPKAELFSEMGDRAFQEIIQDPDAETVQLHDRLNYLNHSILLSPLAARSDLNRDEAEQVIRRLEPIIQRVNADAEGLQQGG